MKTRKRAGYALLVVLAGYLATPSPVRADAIDGNWCAMDGRRLSIAGPEVVTPAGTRLIGHYARHSFWYQIPENEKGTGAVVAMFLIDDDTLHLNQRAGLPGGGETPTEVWHRCQPSLSDRGGRPLFRG